MPKAQSANRSIPNSFFRKSTATPPKFKPPRNYVVEEAVFILLQRAVLYFFIGPVVVELVEVERLILVLGILVEKIGPIDISKSNTGLSIPQFFFQPLKDGLLPPILQSLLVRLVGQAVNADDDIWYDYLPCMVCLFTRPIVALTTVGFLCLKKVFEF